MTTISTELFDIFDARRVKGLDQLVNGWVGWFRNRRRVLPRLRKQVEAIERLEPEIRNLGSTRFAEEVGVVRDLARLGRLEGDALMRAVALAREGAWRSVGMRPFPCQLMGALAMFEGNIAEMATGEGKTLTAAIGASILAWAGRPVHVITVNDYLVARDAEEMAPVYKILGHTVGHVVHECPANMRYHEYRKNVVYVTSKELVADFLRDQIQLGHLRSASETMIHLLERGPARAGLLVPGLWKVIVDEADSLLIDEAVTPLIISNSPNTNPNERLYRLAAMLADQLEPGRDFTVDRTVRTVDLTARGHRTLNELAERMAEAQNYEGDSTFFLGQRRREELVQQALVARHCFFRDEHYIIDHEQKVQIIDESTGRIMADRSWRHGLHQAIEIKEGVPVTADKENLARLSFQRFFRQYPMMAGMTGTAWEAAAELWQIYRRPVVRIPTNKPCIRKQLPIRMFDTAEQKWDAVVKRVMELNDQGVPVLVGTRSIAASEEVSKRLFQANRPHRVLNATQTAQEASIVAEAGLKGKITVATNMAGRGTDIKISDDVREIGGLHVIATEPHGSGRVDRQLFGRAARQGDPGCAQMFCSAEDDLFIRYTPRLRHMWRAVGVKGLIRIAQARAERMARYNRKQVLRSDNWMDEALPF